MRRPTNIKTITSPYGMRNGSWHNGTDYATPLMTELFVPKDGGKLHQSAWDPTYGNFIVLDYGQFQFLYAHLYTLPKISVSEVLYEGESLGYISGNSGNSTGPHLHFECRIGSVGDIWKKDPDIKTKFLTSVDPELFLKKELPIDQMLKLTVYQWEDWELFQELCDGVASSGAIGPEELEHIIKMGASVKDLYAKLFKF